MPSALVAPAARAAGDALVETTENGFDVTRTRTTAPVPRGRIGSKTTERETRVGNTEETLGDSRTTVFTIGGFVDRCPSAEGKVPGDFEFAVTSDIVAADDSGITRSHYEKRATARMEARNGPNGQITAVDMEFTSSTDIAGVRSSMGPTRVSFRLGEGGQPNMDDVIRVSQISGDLVVAGLIYTASMAYIGAMPGWLDPKSGCVEIGFDPPSGERAATPNESIPVTMTVRTAQGSQPIADATYQGGAIEAKGRVTPGSGKTRADGTLALTYVATADPQPSHGIDAAIVSAAGVAEARWKIRVGDDYELLLESSITSSNPLESARSTARGSVRLTASTKPWRRKPDGKTYRLHEGEGSVQYTTAPGPERNPCAPLIQGSGIGKLSILESLIQITPPSQQAGGTTAPGKAEIQLTYWITSGGGESETEMDRVNYVCVPGEVSPQDYWLEMFRSGRGVASINFLADWEYVGRDGIVARKVLTGNCSGTCTAERSVFTLRKK